MKEKAVEDYETSQAEWYLVSCYWQNSRKYTFYMEKPQADHKVDYFQSPMPKNQ